MTTRQDKKDKKPHSSIAYPSGAATVPIDGERSDLAMEGSNSNQAKNPHLGSRVKNRAVLRSVLAVARLLATPEQTYVTLQGQHSQRISF